MLNIQTNKSAYFLSRFSVWFLFLMAAYLLPLYFLQSRAALKGVWYSPLHEWLPVLRVVVGDILKLAVFLWFGFYFKDYAARRASLEVRRRDALHMTVLLCLFFLVLLPWYVFIFALAFSFFIYKWEMRDIRVDEKARAFDAAYGMNKR